MSQQLDSLIQEVKHDRDVMSSAVMLIKGLVQKLDEAKDDPAKIEALRLDLQASTQELADAITANTGDTPNEPATAKPDDNDGSGEESPTGNPSAQRKA